MEHLQPSDLLTLAVTIVMVIASGYIWEYRQVWWPALQALFHYFVAVSSSVSDDNEHDMSSSGAPDTRSAASVSQTDSPQTDRQTTDDTAPPKEYLTLYRLMREHGISREQARPALKAAGVPLDNNLWSKSAPVPVAPADTADDLITPFAGRRTKRSYYPDQTDLEYQPPQKEPNR